MSMGRECQELCGRAHTDFPLQCSFVSIFASFYPCLTFQSPKIKTGLHAIQILQLFPAPLQTIIHKPEIVGFDGNVASVSPIDTSPLFFIIL